MIAKPLAKTGQYLLDALGITKNTDNFFLGLQRELVPVINASPFLAVEQLIERDEAITIDAAGLVPRIFNTGRTAWALFGATITSDPLAAGEQCEVRPIIIGRDDSNPFNAQLGTADFASGVLESLYSGGLFFTDPVIVLPGWSIGEYVSTISAAASITARLHILYAEVGG